MRKIVKIKKIKNDQVCLSNDWINKIIENKDKYNEYKCIISDENDIDLINFININNKNNKNNKVKDISFLKDYLYLKIIKNNVDKNVDEIFSVVILKKQKIFIKDEDDFKIYNSILIDYICEIQKNFYNKYEDKSNETNTDNKDQDEDKKDQDEDNKDDELNETSIDTNDIINISIKKFLEVYNMDLSCFIHNNEKNKDRLLCKKIFYYRPISVDKLMKCNILKYYYIEKKILEKIYNTFSYHESFLSNVKLQILDCNNYSDDEIYILAEILSYKLLKYNKKNLDIFEYINENEMYNILKNPLFYKFIIRNEYDEITDFVCIQCSYIKNNRNDIYCKNGNYYCSFYLNSTSKHISYILECISEYSYKKGIFDIITLCDFFTGEDSNYFKLIRKSSVYYYANNIKSNYIINSRKNGLLSIFN